MLGFRNLNRCDLFVALNILYSMQGLLYPQGAINQILQVAIIVWGLIISSKYFLGFCKQAKLLKATSALIFMYCVYGVILILFGNSLIEHIPDAPARYIYLQVSLRSLLKIYVFYYYASKGFLTSSRIRVYAAILLFSLVPNYYYQQAHIMALYNRNEVTNNMGYTFLAIIPMLFFFNKKQLLQYCLLAVALLYIVFAMKRGAIAIGIVATVSIIGSNLFSNDNKHKFLSILFTIALIVGTVYVTFYMMSESAYFVHRVEQTLSGDSSGRDNIYDTLWHYILNEQNIFYILFGRGADSTWAVVGNYAHQDWLETLCNNGLIGGVILMCFYLRFFRDAYRSRNLFSMNFFIAYMILFFISFSKTLFSMSIQDIEISISILIGFFTYWICRPYKEITEEEIV